MVTEVPAVNGGEGRVDTAAEFDEFYSVCATRVVRQLVLLTGDAAEAEDVTQEAFERAWLRWSTVRDLESPEAWVRTVSRRLAVSRWRRARTALNFVRRQRHVEKQMDGPNPERVALVEALGTLPDTLRRAMVLRYMADLTVAQIADREGVPEGTVKSWLHRGRTALAAQLRPSEEAHRD